VQENALKVWLNWVLVKNMASQVSSSRLSISHAKPCMPNFTAERKKIAEHAALRKEAASLYKDPQFKPMIALLNEVYFLVSLFSLSLSLICYC